MKPTYSLIAAGICSVLSTIAAAKPLDGKSTDVLMQGFTWTSSDSGSWYSTLAGKAPELKSAGISMIWMPPPSNTPSFAKQGYLPVQLNVLDSYYGSEAQLKSTIQTLHDNGIKAIADIVINHRAGFSSWHDFKNPDWGTDAITSNDECWTATGSSCTSSMPKGAADSGEGYTAARDIDHSQEYVRTSIKTWLNDRLKGAGFDGWRYDYVKGFNGKYVGEYNTASDPYFSVGEYWTTLWPVSVGDADNHRKLQSTWIDQTGGNSAAFDFTTKGVLNDVLGWYKDGETKAGNNNYALLKGADGKPSGLIGLRPKLAVTFVDNHDTGTSGATCTGGQYHWAMTCDRVLEGYAYILTHPGIPSVYWGHYYDRNQKTEIDKLLKIRRDAGLNSESVVNIVKAEQNLYAAIVDEKVAVKLGSSEWTPGTGWTLAASGPNYAVWNKGVIAGVPVACFKPDDAASIKLGDAITFDASCSTDPDGSIASYAWTLDGAALGTAKTQIVQFSAEKAYKIGLKVTDNSGAASELKELSVNLSKDFAKTYTALYVRGTFNTWGKAEMQLTGDNTWTLTQQLPAATDLKFDAAPGNWTINFGDNEADGVAETGDAKNIKVATAGSYLISFNDKTRAYSIKPSNVCAADNDGIDDAWEAANGLDKCVNDAALDPDQDGLTNLQEFTAKTNPQQKDTDGDGFSDGDEVKAGTDPLDKTKFPGCCEPVTESSTEALYPADFNGDGQGDLLWRNKTTGDLYLWSLNANGRDELKVATVSDANWQIAALADFNKDGKTDLLWRHAGTGQTLIWLMNGAALTEITLPVVPTAFKPYALDLTGDGKAELLWRHQSQGLNYVWQFNDQFEVSEYQIETVPVEWQLKGIADINGDHKADLTWRHATNGQTVIWYMDGTNHQEVMLSNLSNEWKILSVQDFNGDGKADILWRNQTTHDVYLTYVEGAGFAADTPFFGNIPSEWQLSGLGDYDKNGKLDTMWRNSETGWNAVGNFDGTVASYGDLPWVALDWSVASAVGSKSVEPEQGELTFSVNPSSGSFSSSIQVSLTVGSGNLTVDQCRYTQDSSEPKTSATAQNCVGGTQQLTLGAAAAAGSQVQLKVYAKNSAGAEKTETLGSYSKQSVEPVTLSRLGVTYSAAESTFAVWSPDTAKVGLRLDGKYYPMQKIADFNGYTNVYAVTVPGDHHLKKYNFLMNYVAGQEASCKYITGASIDRTTCIVARDPYAVMVVPGTDDNVVVDLAKTEPDGGWAPLPALVAREDAIIYEVHVRDFTFDASSGVDANKRGKFLGMVQGGTTFNTVKTGIDHLKELGVTHVQLLPMYDYATCSQKDWLHVNKKYAQMANGEDCYNWGYDPENFNIPEERYAVDPTDYVNRIKEVKTMINEFHKAGIRVVMDVVYNHTWTPNGDLNPKEQVFENLFSPLSSQYFYKVNGKYYDLSGTGNTIDPNVPMVSRFIQDSLDFWASEYRMDGFRFDLVGIFSYNVVGDWAGKLNAKFPDRHLLTYGEPWNGYATDPAEATRLRLGTVARIEGAHFGAFNEPFRKALKGESDKGTGGGFIFNQANGGTDGFGGLFRVKAGTRGGLRASNNSSTVIDTWDPMFATDPEQSINYISAHDNMSLYDKIREWASLNGQSSNSSYLKRINQFSHGILLTSQGLPFIYGGEEILRDKKMDHNSYMSADSVNKFDWATKAANMETFNYFKQAIALRRANAGFRLNTWNEINSNVDVSNPAPGVVLTNINVPSGKAGAKQIQIIYNSGNNYTHTLSGTGWKVMMESSDATKGNGRAVSGSVVAEGTAVTVLTRD